jgi:sugar phosphate isomerase/epimerase
MRLACSTIHYHAAGWPLDRTLRDIAEAGYAGVEINLGLRWSPEVLAPGAPARRVLEDTGLVPVALMASLFWLGEDRSSAAATRCVGEQILERAGELGVPHVLVATGPWPDDVEREAAHEELLGNLRWLVASAPEGVAIVSEAVGVPWPHSHWPIYNVESFQSYRALVPELKANFDTNNYLTAGDEPVEAIERLGEAIVGVHLKDARFLDGRYRNIQAGQGVIDFAAALDALRRGGYDGWIVAEDESWITTQEHDPPRIARETHAVYAPLLEAVSGARA